MKRLLATLLLIFAASAAPAADAPVAHGPALWKVLGKHCTVYLFGSVHILSPTITWEDARIDKAIGESDTFYFETSLDGDAVKGYIASKGALPPGQSLRAMLPPEAQKNLDDDLTMIGLPEANIDSRRPWLATLAMIGLKYRKSGLPSAGVDIEIMQDAQSHGKALRYFETIEQQVALLAQDDPKTELQSFEMFLKDFKTEDADIDPLIDAWTKGDEQRLARLLMKGFDKYPDERKIMFDDRNTAWVKVLSNVLDTQSGTFFVTVGAGHLLTARGVPAQLSRAGYTVVTL